MLKKTVILTLTIFAAALLCNSLPAYAQINDFKITASDGAASNEFGSSVSIFGDYAVVGARNDDDNGSGSGSAYVFKRTGTSWVQEAKLLPSDGAASNEFGNSVSIFGDYAVVGARNDDDNGSGSGSAYVFKRAGTNWTQEAKLLPSDGAASNEFGFSVSISGDYAVVGARGDDDNGLNSGSAYVFKRTGTSWVQEAKLLASDGSAEEQFGISVSISGDYAVVGVWGDTDNGPNSGSAYLFKRTSTSWTQEAKLLPSDGAAFDNFGVSVSISGDYVVAGAQGNDGNGEDSGSAYVFKRTGTSWVEEEKLIASDGAEFDNFGFSVSISGDNTFVGAFHDDDNGSGSGSAYLFKRTSMSWTQEAKLLPSDGAAFDEFGVSVSIYGDYVVAGAWFNDGNELQSGSAYVYNLHDPFVANPIPDIIADEDFGSSVVALLDTVFDDLDLPNDSLRYSVTVSSGVITANISGDILQLFSVTDLNGIAEVVVTVTDDSSASVSDTFMVTINPLQNEDRLTGAILRGDNSVPPVTSSATGTFTGALTNDWTELHYSITIEGLTPTVAHFHNGAFDETGGVVKTLDFSNGMTISGVWSSSDGTQPFTTELLNELLAGRIYVNIHTEDNPGGEIRGNIQVPVLFKALLSGDKSVPPVGSSGVGTGAAFLIGSERNLFYALNVTGLTPTASHFHGGSATGTGGVVKTIDLVNDNADGEWLGDDAQPLSDSLITELLLGNIYMNVHTSAEPGGEIRSQLEREDATTFLAFINGENQVPPNASISSGFAFLTLNSAQTQAEYDITLSQLSADSLSAAHFHNAGAVLSGGVVKTLDFVDGHAKGVWSASDTSQALTAVLVEELLSGRLYVNVHTNAFPAGEIRGQVIVISGYNAQLSGSQSVPPVISSGSGTFTSLFFYADSGAELEYNITVEGLNITAAHFHAGSAGESGGVIEAITFEGNSANGVWRFSDDDIVDMIRNAGVYVNIHTSANPGGEIRGQLLPGIIEVPVGVVDEDVAQLPTTVQLKQNYPNPFNPVTSIEYAIPYEDKIVLTIYNILGEEIIRLIDETQPAGNYEITWDATGSASGIYFYRLQAGDFVLTRKMVLLK